MIQRKQSIYLFLMVVVVSACLWANPAFYKFIGSANTGEGELYHIEVNYLKIDKIMGETVSTVGLNAYLTYSVAVMALVSLVSIFLFKSRKTQLLLCNVNYLVILLMAVLMYLAIQQADTLKFYSSEGSIGVGIFAPLMLLVLNFLALKGIKADEALIRSMNRLR